MKYFLICEECWTAKKEIYILLYMNRPPSEAIFHHTECYAGNQLTSTLCIEMTDSEFNLCGNQITAWKAKLAEKIK